MSYAVVLTGGKQYRVMKGETLRVELLDVEAGSEIKLDNVLMIGDGETIKAAIVVADVRNSTILAEQMGLEPYIGVLNTFFDAAAGAFADGGGHILSFLGDGFLAIYPSGDSPKSRREACQQAYVAAVTAAPCASSPGTDSTCSRPSARSFELFPPGFDARCTV